ncbi:hypothetical protein CCACVL1_18579 [Corchorus capsularis]|uniref:Uncharacterized protein n=1 Tax=Corchorus capsularis TaxID=210143 RepID=A0A1R3HKK0_COCAP|nr:hypothetical protein CCACVL1_18579 [Corchorus capsularis]
MTFPPATGIADKTANFAKF